MNQTTEMRIKVSEGRILKAEAINEDEVVIIVGEDDLAKSKWREAETTEIAIVETTKTKIEEQPIITTASTTADTTTRETRETNNYTVPAYITKKQDKPEIIDGKFKLVRASELSIKDDFMQCGLGSKREGALWLMIARAIDRGPKDFYHPIYDPSFDKDGNIVFVEGNKPAVGKSFDWWRNKAAEMTPVEGKKFSIGNGPRYAIFLGCLMKELYYKGVNPRTIWQLVCEDSTDLGNFKKHDTIEIKKTGSNPVCGWYDLGNTTKMLDKMRLYEFYLAGGNYMTLGYNTPLADVTKSEYVNKPFDTAVGWFVLK